MFLDVSAMYLLDLHRTLEEDRRRDMRRALRREALLGASGGHDEDSHGIVRVPRRDRAGRGGDPRADLDGRHDLNPATGTE